MSDTVNSTIKLYDEDAYAVSFQAAVVDVTSKKNNTIDIVLDRTLFFPEEGGQNSDIGTISILGCVYKVIDVQLEKKDGCEIIHHLVLVDEETKIESFIGENATGKIDWQDRFDKMQNHSGEHIISGLVHNMYGYDNVGFHLNKEVFTMDISGTLSNEDIAKIELMANDIVYENVSITAKYHSNDELKEMDYRSKLEFENGARIVRIGTYDACACCAPHVRCTGEIGIIKIIKAENWKGGMRLTVLCGKRAVEDYVRRQNLLQEMTSIFSTSEDKLVQIVDNMRNAVTKAEHELAMYQTNSLYEILIEENSKTANDNTENDNTVNENTINENKENVMVLTEITNAQAIRTAVDKAMDTYKDAVFCVLSGSDEIGYRYLIGSRNKDVKEETKDVLVSLGAKGGGNSDMLQGMMRLSLEEITMKQKYFRFKNN